MWLKEMLTSAEECLRAFDPQQVQPPQWDIYDTPENIKHFLTQRLTLYLPMSQLVHHRDNAWTFNALQTFSKE